MMMTYTIYMQAVLLASATFGLFIIGALTACWFYGGYLLKKDKQNKK